MKKDSRTADDWFKLTAVSAHEDVHLTHFEPELELIVADIESQIEALSVPNIGQNAIVAKSEIMELVEFNAALEGLRQSWLTTLLGLGDIDHDSGTAQAAMYPILGAMKLTICNYAIANGWPYCNQCF